MKRLFTSILMAGALFATAGAQAVAPESYEGYYRLTNAGFQEALTVNGKFDFTGTVPNPANIGSIFRIETGPMANLAKEMEKLEQLLNAGLITNEEYMQRFMALLSAGNTWYYGCYPIEKLSAQGVDYAEMIAKLPDYADLAIESFINNDAATLYSEYRETLTLLCVFASEIISPGNLETEATFKKWCENYLTQWRNATIFQLYLQPVYSTPDVEEDEEAVGGYTGEVYFRFHTPPYVGNMEKAIKWINSIMSDNGNNPDAPQFDLWASAKEYMLAEIAKDYPEGTPAYNFVKELFKDTYMNTDYLIGEGENGGISLLGLPSTFSGFDEYDGPEFNITADDMARCTWKIETVDAASPFAVAIDPKATDGKGNYFTTLYTAFPYQLSGNMKAYYATSVNKEGVAALEAITGNVVAAETAVVISNTSAELADNKLIPLVEGGSPVSGNALKGVLYSEKNSGVMVTIGEGGLFKAYYPEVPANTAYYDGEISGIGSLVAPAAEGKMYDMMGREVKDPNAKGIFIINGKKVVK